MTDARPFIYQCAACGVVFGPQSATDALVAAQASRDALASLLKEAEDVLRLVDTTIQDLRFRSEAHPVSHDFEPQHVIRALLSRIAAVQKGG